MWRRANLEAMDCVALLRDDFHIIAVVYHDPWTLGPVRWRAVLPRKRWRRACTRRRLCRTSGCRSASRCWRARRRPRAIEQGKGIRQVGSGIVQRVVSNETHLGNVPCAQALRARSGGCRAPIVAASSARRAVQLRSRSAALPSPPAIKSSWSRRAVAAGKRRPHDAPDGRARARRARRKGDR